MKAAKKWHYFRIALILGSNVELTDLYVLLWGFKQRVNINLVISILKIPLTSNTDDTFLGLLSAFEQVPGALFSRPRSPFRSWLRPSVDPEASRRTLETISGTQGIVSFKGMKISGFVIF